MQFTILFLLMGGLSIATAVTVDEIEKDLKQFLQNQKGNPINSKDHSLKLLDECLGRTDQTLVWKALFDGHRKVAIKISTEQSCIDQEIDAYRAANATNDPNIESKGIPRIYYTGRIFKEKYPVIVMSLFEETLAQRWMKQHESLNAYSILEVFLQLARTLDYLHSRGVMHKDIEPRNIFFRGYEVFLGDFDLATCDSCSSSSCSSVIPGTSNRFNARKTKPIRFGSSSRWKKFFDPKTTYTFIDDLESLVYTIWCIERIGNDEPSGYSVNYNRDRPRFVMEKCKYFKKFPRSYEAMKFICYDEMLSNKPYPDYKSIVTRLKAAKAEVEQKTGQKTFEWLDCASSSSSSSSSESFASSPPPASSFKFGYPFEVGPVERD